MDKLEEFKNTTADGTSVPAGAARAPSDKHLRKGEAHQPWCKQGGGAGPGNNATLTLKAAQHAMRYCSGIGRGKHRPCDHASIRHVGLPCDELFMLTSVPVPPSLVPWAGIAPPWA